MDRPVVQYALSGDVSIAFQAFGEGPIELVCVPGFISNLYYNWEIPSFRRLLTRLATFARVVILDRRGLGLSDRVSRDLPPLEVLVDDLVAVLDAAEMDRPAIFGWESASTLAILFAATHPERTSALITFGSNPCGLIKPDWPHGWDEHDAWEPYFARALEGWGTLAWTTEYMETYEPDSVQLAPLMLHMFQLAASPTTGTALERIDMGTDIRHVLPTVRVPTLVLYRPGGSEPAAVYDYLGEGIAGAKVVALPGRDDSPWLGDVDTVVDEVEEFLTGVRHRVETDRVLATVLFTDIVDSTAQAMTLGDARWKECLVAHDDVTRREVDRHHGRYVKQTGDGLLAIFDGPARAVRCAQAIMSAVRPLGIQIRAGVHTGEVELGLDDVHGIAVHLGARVMSLAQASEILTSSTVKDLTVGSGLAFEDVGDHELKGAPDSWQLYRVTGG